MENGQYLKGRGAQINPANPYHKLMYDENPVAPEDWEEGIQVKTEFIEVHSNRVLPPCKAA